ncbi:MAG: hypothetical protein ACOVRP_00210 [Gemmatimonas sp.]|jgi:hypothetical protein
MRRPFLASLFGALSLCVTAVAHAQRGPVSYVYLRGTDTLGVETLTAFPDRWVGALTMKGQPTIEWTHARAANDRLGALRIRVLQPPPGASAPPIQDVLFSMKGDSLQVSISTGTNRSSQTVRSPSPDMVPLVNASVLHAAFVADYGARRKLDRIPIVLTTGAQTADAFLAKDGAVSVLTLGKVSMRITPATDGIPQRIDIPAQNSRVVRR